MRVSTINGNPVGKKLYITATDSQGGEVIMSTVVRSSSAYDIADALVELAVTVKHAERATNPEMWRLNAAELQGMTPEQRAGINGPLVAQTDRATRERLQANE